MDWQGNQGLISELNKLLTHSESKESYDPGGLSQPNCSVAQPYNVQDALATLHQQLKNINDKIVKKSQNEPDNTGHVSPASANDFNPRVTNHQIAHTRSGTATDIIMPRVVNYPNTAKPQSQQGSPGLSVEGSYMESNIGMSQNGNVMSASTINTFSLQVNNGPYRSWNDNMNGNMNGNIEPDMHGKMDFTQHNIDTGGHGPFPSYIPAEKLSTPNSHISNKDHNNRTQLQTHSSHPALKRQLSDVQQNVNDSIINCFTPAIKAMKHATRAKDHWAPGVEISPTNVGYDRFSSVPQPNQTSGDVLPVPVISNNRMSGIKKGNSNTDDLSQLPSIERAISSIQNQHCLQKQKNPVSKRFIESLNDVPKSISDISDSNILNCFLPVKRSIAHDIKNYSWEDDIEKEKISRMIKKVSPQPGEQGTASPTAPYSSTMVSSSNRAPWSRAAPISYAAHEILMPKNFVDLVQAEAAETNVVSVSTLKNQAAINAPVGQAPNRANMDSNFSMMNQASTATTSISMPLPMLNSYCQSSKSPVIPITQKSDLSINNNFLEPPSDIPQSINDISDGNILNCFLPVKGNNSVQFHHDWEDDVKKEVLQEDLEEEDAEQVFERVLCHTQALPMMESDSSCSSSGKVSNMMLEENDDANKMMINKSLIENRTTDTLSVNQAIIGAKSRKENSRKSTNKDVEPECQNEERRVIRKRKPRTYKYNPKPVQPKGTPSYVPDNQKDEDYWINRKRNNEASKKSRGQRRKKELETLRALEEIKAEKESLNEALMELRKEKESLADRNLYLQKEIERLTANKMD